METGAVLAPPRAADAGTCAARLPREALLDGGAARAVLISGSGVPSGRTLLCVALQLERGAKGVARPQWQERNHEKVAGRGGSVADGEEIDAGERRGRREGRGRRRCSGLGDDPVQDNDGVATLTPAPMLSETPIEACGVSGGGQMDAVPLRVLRVDQTLAFDTTEPAVPGSPGRPLSVTPAASFAPTAVDGRRRRRSAPAGAWREASCVVVEPHPDAGPPAAVLARAAAALRAVGCVPASAPLRLYSADGSRCLARLVASPAPPVAIGSGTRFVLRVEEDAARREEAGRYGNAARAPCAAERAVVALLRQDVDALRAMGAAPAAGLLLSGPPGVGKTSSVYSAARACGFQVLAPAPAQRGVHGGVAHALRAAFAEARSRAARSERVLVFLDEVDALCPRRGESGGEEGRAVAQLLVLMDGADGGGRIGKDMSQVVYVVGATNQPGALDLALRRPGRFDREVLLSAPNVGERAAMLRAFDPRLVGERAVSIAEVTAGYVAADLVQLCAEAAKSELDEFGWNDAGEERGSSIGSEQDAVGGNDVSLTEHYINTLRIVRPSLLRGNLSAEVAATRWEDIGGLEEVKKRLRMAVEWPLAHPATFARLGLYSPRGVLLHGPPGCSKTTLVRAMASSGRANFLHMSGADVYSCFVGEAERLVRNAFSVARAAAPSILFLDEVDALVGKRGSGGSSGSGGGDGGSEVQARVLSTLLTEMDGLAGSDGVLVVGATNRVDLLDDALLRPGRFDEIIHVGCLTDVDRLAALRVHARALPAAPDLDLPLVAQWMSGASGAQVAAVCQEAALHALRAVTSSSFRETTAGTDALLGKPAVMVGMDDMWAAIQVVI